MRQTKEPFFNTFPYLRYRTLDYDVDSNFKPVERAPSHRSSGLGHIAKNKEEKNGMRLAGMILGYVSLGFTILGFIMVMVTGALFFL